MGSPVAEPEADTPPSMPPAAAMYRLGGRTYPAEVVRGCPVCSNPLRAMIETHLVMGRSFASIARSLPAWAGVLPSAISRHARKGHLPLAEEVRRRIVSDRSEELGQDMEAQEGQLGDYLSFLRLGVADATDRLVRREVEPTLADGIRMAEILARLGLADADRSSEVDERMALQTRALRSILSIVRSMLDDVRYREFSMRVMADPDVAALLAPGPEGSSDSGPGRVSVPASLA